MTGALESLDGLSVSIVGPGRVGASFACWLRQAGAAVLDVVGREAATAEAVAAMVGGRPRRLAEGRVRGDLVVVAVADGAVAEVARLLDPESEGAVVVHTAGRWGVSALAELAGTCERGAWHPLRAFSRVETEVDASRGMVLAIDGGEGQRALAERVGRACGWVVSEVAEPQRELYHLAATVAAGGAATMLAAARRLAARTGLGEAVAGGYAGLAANAIEAVAATAAAEAAGAITGPAARGEASLAQRIAAAQAVDPELGAIAGLGAFATLLVRHGASIAGSRDEDLLRELSSILQPGAFLDPPKRR